MMQGRRIRLSGLGALCLGLLIPGILSSADGEAAAGPAPDLTSFIVTPPPGAAPRFNGAAVFGVRPGSPILYALAVSGLRPLRYAAEGLPEGATFDAELGRIGGSVAKAGTYRVHLRAENAAGRAERELRLVVGEAFALTPPMGCNTWGGLGPSVSEKGVRASAGALVRSGLVQHGYCYVNIDDGWQGERGGPLQAIQPNEKFGDMKRFCDDLHALGLKVGNYSTPWRTSYAGFTGGSSNREDGAWERMPPGTGKGWTHGARRFEIQDARQAAAWGIDYFKYDWGIDSVDLARSMGDALLAQPRDIVLELSNTAPFQDAAAYTAIGAMTRTDGDLVDVWVKTQLDPAKQKWALGIRDLWLAHKRWKPYNRPGHWNMPCPLRVGMLGGWDNKPLRPSRLTVDEQFSHVSLWCLWSAPLIIGAPIDKLDAFTLSLLTNDEVLDLDQDPLGRQAEDLDVPGGEILVKKLADGGVAVGLFNPGEAPSTVAVTWAQAGVAGPQRVRDLWRHRDLGVFTDRFEARVPVHGVELVKLAPAPAAAAESQGRAEESLAAKMSQAWEAVAGRYYSPKTSLFYTTPPEEVPLAAQFQAREPNLHGAGTGAEDCSMFGGILLAALCDQFEATREAEAGEWARKVFAGLRLAAIVHGQPGFIARGVCEEDGKSIYPGSSRDQFTHSIHGMWRYYRSPLSSESEKQSIREILCAVADKMTREVTFENGYSFRFAFGLPDDRGVARMRNVRVHEAARLPMFYAAAWDVARKEEHGKLYRELLPLAVHQSLDFPGTPEAELRRWVPAYSVLQMQASLELLLEVEPDAKMAAAIRTAMKQVAGHAESCPAFDLTNRSHRDRGEVIAGQLMSPDYVLSDRQRAFLADSIRRLQPGRDPSGCYGLMGAYWRARARGQWKD